MILPPYTWNGNTVIEYGRLFYIVTSNSRKGLIHFVDLEESTEWKARFLCTCEAFKFGERPCRHISACFHAIAEWCNIRQEVREEWVDRLMFLLKMGHSFRDSLQSPSLTSLQPEPPKTLQQAVRYYTLPPRDHETTTANSKRKERGLPARLRSHSLRPTHKQGS